MQMGAMPSGTLCQLDFSWRAAYGQDERIEVHGAGGMIRTRQEQENMAVYLARWINETLDTLRKAGVAA